MNLFIITFILGVARNFARNICKAFDIENHENNKDLNF